MDGTGSKRKNEPEIREMLLSHSIGIAGAYYKPSDQEMLGEYMRAVDNGFFCVSEEKVLRRKVEKLEVEASQFNRLAAQIGSARSQITKIDKKIYFVAVISMPV